MSESKVPDKLPARVDRLLLKRGPLKAREISRHLKVDKSEINSYLYGSNHYGMDGDFRWSLREPIIVNMPGQWISDEILEGVLLRQLTCDFDGAKTIIFRFQSGSNLMLEAYARLLSLSNQLAASNHKVIFDFEEHPSLRSYLTRMRFFDIADPSIVVLPRPPSRTASSKHYGGSESLVELHGIRGNENPAHLPEKLADCFVRHFNNAKYTPVFTIFAELIDNIYEHSNSEQLAFVAIQDYKKPRHHVHIAVSDSGSGITQTMLNAIADHYPELGHILSMESPYREAALLRKMFLEEGHSCRGRSQNRGLGLSRTRVQSGNLWNEGPRRIKVKIREKHTSVTMDFDEGRLVAEPTARGGLVEIRGTQICFDAYSA